MSSSPPLRGLWKLTWLEIKIFVREPMGFISAIGIPVLIFVVLGRTLGQRLGEATTQAAVQLRVGLPIFAAVFIAINTVLSLVAIISIYREGGILKRLRATPLAPVTILVTHVLVKLLLTAVTVVLMVLAGRRYYPAGADVPVVAFSLALLLSTWSILSIGFIIASVVRTARFAPPLGSLVLGSMLPFSGLFPIDLPPSMELVSRAMPLTYAVSLLSGVWRGEPWSAHLGDIGALVVVFSVCTLIASRVFRWE
ncbi:MAG: ABC transporter [Acidobacteria bacterium]|jgi:ABC-2 type transport system permease protein|nr:ABC transporter [Acidobacteriota bacterium]MDP7338010.1 ABC transporter permease [Vicinamibacterales bacterium]MDP7478917.1 ABC transporter permease [Vicinamibacterales bacterium]MDP7692807.1 ABC transporter permease [Vicinamibacterales bacterium]HJN46528.1 ABC transporter permease [Vicinamibacterales bacterium]|tara:strand:- start:4175 stop:4933 length:759 start_codon:yes stop_codon:yes gene_type:complete